MAFRTKSVGPSLAAKRLGISIKALRLYEKHGLISPDRNASGWRVYGSGEMARATKIVILRELGLSIAQTGRVLKGDGKDLKSALAVHEAALEAQMLRLGGAIDRIRALQDDLDGGRLPRSAASSGVLAPLTGPDISFELPWPWDGERFELPDMRPITYITGPLGSGKTRLAERIAKALPNAVYLGFDRIAEDCAVSRALLGRTPDLKDRVDRTMTWLVEEGAVASPALSSLLAAIEAEPMAPLVVDMPEQGLDASTQEALMAFLRRRGPGARSIVLLTRSCVILDLASVGENEAIILCPANHSTPVRVRPYPGSAGYESVATCLASPEVRKRTEGVIAVRPEPR